MQTNILATDMDMMDTIIGHYQEAPDATQWNSKTAIDKEDVQLFMYFFDMYPHRFLLEYNGYQTNQISIMMQMVLRF
jgi:hypothetical protein